ncbi:MAG: glutaminase A [Deltaproteobacteria bacterium]|nr:glutaminase A [Deltaproteobacteria bacterium]
MSTAYKQKREGRGIQVDQNRNGAIDSPIQAYLEELCRRFAKNRDGDVATYIPELAKADPEWFGISIATSDGQVYEAGDSRQTFTIQSISKPFTYGLALEDRGRDAVLAKIGVEPTGDAFNSISLAPGTGCPLNPMINAGAIAAASLVAGRSPADKLERLMAVFSFYAGRHLDLDVAVYESESQTGHRNRAIGHMLRNFGILTEDPEPVLDLYFRQCSIAVDCHDLALMAATLANGGVNPRTGERAVRADLVPSILSVMTTCGMYDSAGEWVYWVGMPAKSGVAGGVLAVLPGQLGIGIFSPRLDAHGNSVRGVAVCKELSQTYNLHLTRAPRALHAAVRSRYTLASISSRRMRHEAERKLLDADGHRARVYDVHGDLTFSAVEPLVRQLVDISADVEVVVIGFRRAEHVDDAASRLLLDLALRFAASGKHIVFVSLQRHPGVRRFLEEGAAASGVRLPVFRDIDPALEWCENLLLRSSTPALTDPGSVQLVDHNICRGMAPQELHVLEGLLEPRRFGADDLIIREGDAAQEIYLLMRGEVSVTVDLPNGQRERFSTLAPGMAFGELAVVNRGVRNADVRADTEVECYALSTAAFDRLGETHPAIKITVLENLLRNVARMLSRANQELATLAS